MANHLNDTWFFDVALTDGVPPFVDNQVPAPGEANVAGTTNISFQIHDVGFGVDISSIDVEISLNGSPSQAILGGVFQPGFSGTITPIADGYAVEINPATDIPDTTIVTVAIDAADLAVLVPNTMSTVTYVFYTPHVTPISSLAQCRIHSLVGGIIQLDGRTSYAPDGGALTYEWKFVQVPVGSAFEADLNVVNPASIKDLRPTSYSAISFIPDVRGDYLVELTVLNGPTRSEPSTALIQIGLTRSLCGAGRIPAADFVWTFISNFYNLVQDRKKFETIWSGQLALIGAELVKLWSTDYNKSLDTIQSTVQRRWQRFVLHTDVSANAQRVVVGNNLEGTTAITGEIGAPGAGNTNVVHALLANVDFTSIDINYGAKGRIIDVNGQSGTVSRVANVTVSGTSYSVAVLDEETLTDGQVNVPFRIPHMIHFPLQDLEAEGVRVGDVLVLEWTRRDSGLSAEMAVRILAVDRERIGFEFTQAELSVGDPTLDYDLFRQLVQDLRIASTTASDMEISAAANSLIAFVPQGINLSNRPFSSYQITVKAKTVIHNTAKKVNDLYVSIPFLQEEVRNDPPVILRENYDYQLENGYLVFAQNLFGVESPAPEELWAECTHVDNTPAIEANFGALVELKSDDLVEKATRAPYLAAIKGLWFALTNGPTVANVRLSLQILMGLPFSEHRGKILDVTHNFSTDSFGQPIGRILAEDVEDDGTSLGIRRFYFFPENIGLETNPLTDEVYKAGDIVEAFAILSKGVEVTDYVKDKFWWIRTLAGKEIQKYFLFKAQVDTDTGVFDEKDLAFALEFIRKVKPVYTDVVASALRALEDDVLGGFADEVARTATLRFYDNPGAFGGHEATFRSNDWNNQGVVLWKGDSRPFSTRSLQTLRDIVTAQNGANVEASSATGFGNIRARQTGDATNPTIEGDFIVLHANQPGAGGGSQKIYEILSTAGVNGPAVLAEGSPGEPETLNPVLPDSSAFPYGSGLSGSVIRRAANPVVRGTNLETIAGALQLAESIGSTFKSDGVQLDDHLIIESGANLGEYRIVSTVAQTVPRDYTPAGVPQITETQVGLVSLAGANPALADLTGQVFRIIKPHMLKTRVKNARVVESGGDMWVEVFDPVTGFPFDVFTPGMVGEALLVQDAENPLNNGTYTMLEYSHAGRMRITTGSPQTSDATAEAQLTIRSRYHFGFEQAENLTPHEIFSAVVS